jgi:hypothetical protein
MTAHACDDTAYPAAAMPDECTCGGELMANPDEYTDAAGNPVNPFHSSWRKTPNAANPDEYNGWTNRETWAANLWLTNTPELYEATLAVVRLARRDGLDHTAAYGPTPNEYTGASTFADMMAGESLELIAELLRDDPRNGNPEMMLRDIGSAWRIDWREIYAGLLEHLDDMAATAEEDESQ